MEFGQGFEIQMRCYVFDGQVNVGVCMKATFCEGAEKVHAFCPEFVGKEMGAGDGPLSGLLHPFLIFFPLFLESLAPGGDVGSVSGGSVHSSSLWSSR